MAKYAPCMVCGGEITSGRSDRKVCSEVCRREWARRRAGAWYLDNRGDPALVERVKAASRRSRLKAQADPAQAEKLRVALSEWRANNREKMLEQERRWRKANPAAAKQKVERRRASQVGAYVAAIDRDQLWDRDGGFCGICRVPIDRSLKWPHRMSLTVDHVIALADGGTHEPANAQLAHMTCNARKGARVQRHP